ncbi:MAG: DUF2490 domain-containing protein [Bryobacteraceae bacterium]|nr:DUF2490 domain-containing protein [Bryobacteraceae bacterium]MCX7603565.1 DUF2490 domain-containing protein [Bryobacteraceae bacterium]
MLACPLLLSAQTDANLHGWYQYFGDHPLNESRWGLHLEAQVRRHDAARAWQNLLLRPAVNFRVNGAVELTAGYGYVSYHRYGLYPVAARWNEHRIFEDLKLRHRAGRFQLQHRFRMEHRWLLDGLYENRHRYMLRATLPLRGPHYLTAWNEVFTPVRPERFPHTVDQNRATLAWGRRLGRHARLEAGYMMQTVWQRNGRVREDNHTLVLALLSDLPFFRRP